MCGWVAGLTALSGLFQYRQQQAQIRAQANAQADMYRAQAQAAQQNARIENRKQEQIADNYAQQQEALRARRRIAEGAQRAETEDLRWISCRPDMTPTTRMQQTS